LRAGYCKIITVVDYPAGSISDRNQDIERKALKRPNFSVRFGPVHTIGTWRGCKFYET
jgi:hypothetical protein